MAGEDSSMEPLEVEVDSSELPEEFIPSDHPESEEIEKRTEDESSDVVDDGENKCDSEIAESSTPSKEDGGDDGGGRTNERLTVFPLSRIKHIIKADPDVSLASSEAVVALSKAAELFVILMSRDAATKTLQTKRKTIQRRDIDILLETKDSYYFLEDTLDS